MISREVLNQIIASQDSDQAKASKLFLYVEKKINGAPEKMFVLIDILKDEPSFDDVTKEIEGISPIKG